MYRDILVLFVLALALSACANTEKSKTTELPKQHYPVGASVAGTDPLVRISPLSSESFEGGGWNAGRLYATYHPGYDESLPKNFRFTQFQGPHSFVAERNITRLGNYSARLHWKHGNPAKWNRDPNKLDNEDRKAMLHGSNASSITATVWHGFSVYFPSDGTELSDSQDPLFFQLHGAPDTTKEGKEPGRNPPLALTITNKGFDVGYGWDARKFAKDTGGQGRNKFTVPLDISKYKDRWVDFVIQVRANPFAEKGFIKMWIDGKQVASRINIQLGYNDDKGLYPSWGWYQTGKNAERDSDMILYLDEIRHVEHLDADYYDVAPGYFAK
ncbi:MAG: polysaccharide lyase [Paraglaciecola sp.]|uniref:heparin lyase I family protein n=1 Tax=Paraglaciecola sp. TaxID=1920173 RepID=UPI00273E8C67|nr:heparin lyase I family protein [Paraglaciecola sp.]MDP5030928.1 polysaccharide lyase [Paraglaciecola sp.]MDP5130921.1 polysaccharide lyase [Paraglaciecola sp.]